MPARYFIGLMSGTSTDGVDGVLADLTDPAGPRIVASGSLPMPTALRDEFLKLNIVGQDELARAALAGNELARLYAKTVQTLLDQAGMQAGQIQAIGAHGQTVRHRPGAGYTIQINNAALLAELTNIDVIADFRSRDVACNGQGAPLVPAFHQALFQHERPRAILNLGGIANLTLLDPGHDVRGFDTGPANVLLDLWCQKKKHRPYDARGAWAATGRTDDTLLDALIHSEPWFSQPPPKSTGRDLFNEAWLAQRLDAYGDISDKDVQATLQSLTTETIAAALRTYAPQTEDVIVCGGGALNDGLMDELARCVARPVHQTSKFNIPVQLVEALAFAWLAWAHDHGRAAGLPSVTGARHANVLGCRYPA